MSSSHEIKHEYDAAHMFSLGSSSLPVIDEEEPESGSVYFPRENANSACLNAPMSLPDLHLAIRPCSEIRW
jgi:hypothetical protein